MKICFIASNSMYNGANLSLIHLSKSLNNEDVDTIIILPCKGEIEDECNKQKVNYKIIYGVNWVYKINRNLIKYKIKFILMKIINVISEFRFYLYLKKNRVDIVHINTLSIGRGAKTAYKLKIPVVWHIREFMEEDLSHSIYNKEVAYELIRKANKIIAVSKSVQQKYKKILKRDIDIIYNGVDIKKFYYPDKQLYKDKNKIKYTIVGSINENKGHTFLIKNFVNVLKSGVCNIYLDIYGKGDEVYINHLKNMVGDYTANIKFRGYCSDIETRLFDTDILFVTSKKEAFGRVTIEGQLAGCLIIGINSGGTAELLSEKKGLLCSMNNEEFCEAIKKSYTDFEECICMAKRGQNNSIYFSVENNMKKILNVYRCVLKGENYDL